jgi:TRAP-type transport system small permease protein
MAKGPVSPDLPPPGPVPGGAVPQADPESGDFAGPAGLIGDSPWMIRAERVLGLLPALILLGMMILTFVNVFMRYLFRQPISGAFEVMSYMLGLMVFLSLIGVAVRSEHVRIGVLDGFIPRIVRRIRAVVVNLILTAACAGLGYRFWLYADRLDSWGERTQMYGLPTGLLARVMSVSTLVCAVIFLALAIMVIARRDGLERVES